MRRRGSSEISPAHHRSGPYYYQIHLRQAEAAASPPKAKASTVLSGISPFVARAHPNHTRMKLVYFKSTSEIPDLRSEDEIAAARSGSAVGPTAPYYGR